MIQGNTKTRQEQTQQKVQDNSTTIPNNTRQYKTEAMLKANTSQYNTTQYN